MNKQLTLAKKNRPAKRDNGNITGARNKSIEPSRARTRNGAWKTTLLDTLSRTPSVTVACKIAGIDRTTAYAHRDKDPEFAAAWDDALMQTIDLLEHRGYQLALRGDEPRLIEFFLRAHRPSIYRETSRVDVGLLGGIVLIPCKAEGAE